ncbi:MAG: class I SAM-dependent methyltransferase [Planctomycetes bacterium]|nr:class I SAM-dependent methyltransferase [Planctomycetota bacterium]
MQVEAFAGAGSARSFYEARFRRGYMEEWDAERWQRLAEVLGPIDLPPGARVLDFGCGTGALTGLLRARWPDAEVHGADPSAAAIARATSRPEADGQAFHVLDEAFVRANRGRFDFVFSHHVLEHVDDLPGAVADLAALLAPGGRMLHALPCGNPGSLPHRLCRLRPDGIDAAQGNRFCFEDPGHLRRLRSDELAAAFAAHGLVLAREAYGYHDLGALRLFSELPPRALLALVTPSAWPLRHWHQVAPLLAACCTLWLLRLPCEVLRRFARLCRLARTGRRRLRSPTGLVLCLAALPAAGLWPLSAPVDAWLRAADQREWQRRRADRRGSEMLLEFASQRPVQAAAGAEARAASLATAAP